MSVRTYQLGLQVENMKRLLSESVMSHGDQLVIVDVQPEYEQGFGFASHEFAESLNEFHEAGINILILYNGEDTLGMISESDYRDWLVENGCEIAYDLRMYDKGYAFFRYCMDEGIEEEEIVALVKHMIANDVNDSRDQDERFWQDFVDANGHQHIRDLMEFSDDCINIPDLMDVLQSSVRSGAYLTGGGLQECFKEVEIAMQVLNKPYKVYTKYTY